MQLKQRVGDNLGCALLEVGEKTAQKWQCGYFVNMSKNPKCGVQIVNIWEIVFCSPERGRETSYIKGCSPGQHHQVPKCVWLYT